MDDGIESASSVWPLFNLMVKCPAVVAVRVIVSALAAPLIVRAPEVLASVVVVVVE